MKRAGRRALLKLTRLAEANDAVAGAAGTLCGVRTADPVVALTFDDGPHARNTEVVLSVLADRGARATFFVVGKQAEKLPTVVAEVLAAGHEVGFHTHDHVNLADSSPWRVWKSVHDGRRRLEDLIGRPVTLFRPPYGGQSVFSYLVAHQAEGLEVVCWSASLRDWLELELDHHVKLALDELDRGGIALLHDGGPSAPVRRGKLLALLLDSLDERGWQALSVSGLLEGRRPRRELWFRFIRRDGRGANEELRPLFLKDESPQDTAAVS